MSLFSPTSFPLTLESLQTTPKRLSRFLDTLERVDVAVGNKTIYNQAYAEVKRNLAACVEQAWEEHVQKPHLWGKGDLLSQAENDLHWGISISGLNDVLTAQKKLSKFSGDSQLVSAMRAVIGEWLPVATAVKELKDHVVKGRAPRGEPAKPVNPNKDVKTCPCCFRAIAVVSSTMAHHGYKRPEQGLQTSSCPGVQFKPLEISSDGLAYILESTRRDLVSAQNRVDDLPNVSSLQRKTFKGFEVVTQESPYWLSMYAAFTHQAERHLDHVKGREAVLSEMLDKWEPTTVSKARVIDDEQSPSP